MRLCARTGCEHEGRWMPALILRAYPDQSRLEAKHLSIQMAVCDEHKASVKVEDFLTDEGWERILTSFKQGGLKPPLRDHVTLEWIEQPIFPVDMGKPFSNN